MQRLIGAQYGDSVAYSKGASNNVYDNDKRRRRKRFKDVITFRQTSGASLLLLLAFGLGLYTVFRLFRVVSYAAPEDIAPVDVLPWNAMYRIPEASEYVGDRSDTYARLRKETDEYLNNPANFKEALNVASKGKKEFKSYDGANYDIYNCPDTPPPGYPFTWKTTEILGKWKANEIDPPSYIEGDGSQVHLHHNSLCIFDYERDFTKAMAYRDVGLPFIVENDPAVLKTVARWNLNNYMERLTNNFLFHASPRHRRDRKLRSVNDAPIWQQPTKLVRMTFANWMKRAQTQRTSSMDPHWYFRLISCGKIAPDGSCDTNASEFLFDELPFFQPKPHSLYLVDPSQQKGIHCRFGMAGVTAQNHYDFGHNAIALLQGKRRYILGHPGQCRNMALFPPRHPSARHSANNWADPDLQEFPEFSHAQSHEVVLQAGQVLFLPHVWFHHIISLDINIQCNTRSGTDSELQKYIDDCGL